MGGNKSRYEANGVWLFCDSEANDQPREKGLLKLDLLLWSDRFTEVGA